MAAAAAQQQHRGSCFLQLQGRPSACAVDNQGPAFAVMENIQIPNWINCCGCCADFLVSQRQYRSLSPKADEVVFSSPPHLVRGFVRPSLSPAAQHGQVEIPGHPPISLPAQRRSLPSCSLSYYSAALMELARVNRFQMPSFQGSCKYQQLEDVGIEEGIGCLRVEEETHSSTTVALAPSSAPVSCVPPPPPRTKDLLQVRNPLQEEAQDTTEAPVSSPASSILPPLHAAAAVDSPKTAKELAKKSRTSNDERYPSPPLVKAEGPCCSCAREGGDVFRCEAPRLVANNEWHGGCDACLDDCCVHGAPHCMHKGCSVGRKGHFCQHHGLL